MIFMAQSSFLCGSGRLKIDQTDANWFFTDLYTSLPYNIAKYLNKVYAKLNIEMINGPWRRKLSKDNP